MVGRFLSENMKINILCPQPCPRGQLAATTVEVAMGVAIMGILFVSLFSGVTMTTATTRLAREDLRATQVLLDRIEGIRLFDWAQLVYSNNFCPRTFTSSYYPVANSAGATGATYYGTLTITNTSLSAGYTNQLCAITVSVIWTNSGIPHKRSMTTYQAQYGMQNYIFND